MVVFVVSTILSHNLLHPILHFTIEILHVVHKYIYLTFLCMW